MAHGAGFALISFFLLAAMQWDRKLAGDWVGTGDNGNTRGLLVSAALMGLLLGVACMVRSTNIIFAIVPIVLVVTRWTRTDKGQRVEEIKPARLCSLVALGGALIGFVRQMIAWKILYGSYLTYTYQGETLHALPRYAGQVLFGLRNSLFVWTPLALVAVGGLVLAARRGQALAIAGLVVLLGTLWIYGSWETYWLGHGFGMRGFVECSPFFFLGLASVWRRFGTGQRRRFIGRLGRGAIVLLVLWNLYFVMCYRADIQPHGEPFAGLELLTQWDRWWEQLLNETGISKLLSKF